jgi:hypothetical protein
LGAQALQTQEIRRDFGLAHPVISILWVDPKMDFDISLFDFTFSSYHTTQAYSSIFPTQFGLLILRPLCT